MLASADFHLAPSRLYLFIFGAILLITSLILCYFPIPWWLKLIAVMIVIAHGSHTCWRYALLRHKFSITTIRYTSEKRWVIQNGEGTLAVDLHPSTTVTTIVMLLHFRVPGKMIPHKSVIFRDSLSTDDFRKLLVILNA